MELQVHAKSTRLQGHMIDSDPVTAPVSMHVFAGHVRQGAYNLGRGQSVHVHRVIQSREVPEERCEMSDCISYVVHSAHLQHHTRDSLPAFVRSPWLLQTV